MPVALSVRLSTALRCLWIEPVDNSVAKSCGLALLRAGHSPTFPQQLTTPTNQPTRPDHLTTGDRSTSNQPTADPSPFFFQLRKSPANSQVTGDCILVTYWSVTRSPLNSVIKPLPKLLRLVCRMGEAPPFFSAIVSPSRSRTICERVENVQNTKDQRWGDALS